MPPIVVLVGFSTAGKSTYLREIKEKHRKRVNYIDSDETICKKAGKEHIYNLFMSMGRATALSYVEDQESLLLKELVSNDKKPILLAAGPFLPLRLTWPEFEKNLRPFVIHLDITAESVYDGLMGRKMRQLKDSSLDQTSPNFRSWDKDVTTELVNGNYIDLSREQSINNIRTHLTGVTNVYKRLRSSMFSVEDLKTTETKNKLIALIEQQLGI